MLTLDIQFHYDCLSCQLSISPLFLGLCECVCEQCRKVLASHWLCRVRCINIYLISKRKMMESAARVKGWGCVCLQGKKRMKKIIMRDSCFQMQWIMLMSWCVHLSYQVMSSRIFKTHDECIYHLRRAYFSSLYLHMQTGAPGFFFAVHFSFPLFDNAIFWFLSSFFLEMRMRCK